ncbi:MAG: hypothetical protein LBT45_03520 [Rickettsiales bacterium]|jgi:hypothetical protein|nr:hypothetical protein [Rickettsiales bacterium]
MADFKFDGRDLYDRKRVSNVAKMVGNHISVKGQYVADIDGKYIRIKGRRVAEWDGKTIRINGRSVADERQIERDIDCRDVDMNTIAMWVVMNTILAE